MSIFKIEELNSEHFFEQVEEKDVYEEVDEETYSKIVRGRQEDDWIIDDGNDIYLH